MAKGKLSCNHDCFNCLYDDCIMNGISSEERKAINMRDMNFTNFGSIIQARAQRSRKRKSYI